MSSCIRYITVFSYRIWYQRSSYTISCAYRDFVYRGPPSMAQSTLQCARLLNDRIDADEILTRCSGRLFEQNPEEVDVLICEVGDAQKWTRQGFETELELEKYL